MGEKGSLSNKALGTGLAIGLIIGLVIGYLVTPQGADTSELEQRISVLEGQVDNLQNQLDNKNIQITNLQSHISELESQIEELEQLVPPLRKGEWNLIATFQGQSETTTDYFYVGGREMRINWTWTSSVEEFAGFSISLYKEGQTTGTEWLINLQKEGTSYVHNIKVANYYLDISEANLDQWSVTVEVFIPE